MGRFSYILDRIQKSNFSDTPFRHIYISELLNAEDFDAITAAREIDIPAATTDAEVFDNLFEAGYKIIGFPGCITDKREYLDWHASKKISSKVNTACEGFGMTLRLMVPETPILIELNEFLSGEEFNAAIAEKFGIDFKNCNVDGGIQKYLDGYEISPHPDIRRKALTFMVNINPHQNSETLNHHTQYLKFKDKYSYVQKLWEFNEGVDRCWVPWDWCETHSVQTQNNTMVIFAPSNNTMHGVKANYNHLNGQRTQLYGNLWHKNNANLNELKWEDLDLLSIQKPPSMPSKSIKQHILDSTPKQVKSLIKKVMRVDSANEIGSRNY